MTSSGGLLSVNSALESAPHDENSRHIVATFLGQVESFFFDASPRASERDHSESTSAEDLARLLLNRSTWLRVLARVRPDRKLLEGLVSAGVCVAPYYRSNENALAKKKRALVAREEYCHLHTSPRVIHRWGKTMAARQNEPRGRCKETKACRRFSNRRRQ